MSITDVRDYCQPHYSCSCVLCVAAFFVDRCARIEYHKGMKFKFSIRRLLFITTAIGVILGICNWLGLFNGMNTLVAALAIYCMAYGLIFAVFLMPRYWSQWKSFLRNLNEIRETRKGLEQEVQKSLAKIEVNRSANVESSLANEGPALPE